MPQTTFNSRVAIVKLAEKELFTQFSTRRRQNSYRTQASRAGVNLLVRVPIKMRLFLAAARKNILAAAALQSKGHPSREAFYRVTAPSHA